MSRGKWWLIAGLVAGGATLRALARRRKALLARRAQNRSVRVLIVGAGVVGSTYAVRLARWGMDVSLLARGQRLQELCTYGLQVQDVLTRHLQTARVRLVTAVSADDDYDLAILAVRYTQAREALEVVEPLAHTTPILLLQHNPAGIEPLGEQPLMLGFPATAGVRRHGLVRSLPLWLGATIIGESDGADTQRLHQTATILRRAGLKVEVQRQIVPWLITQAAMFAVLAGCVYRNGGHVRRMARDAGEVRAYLAALREAQQVLVASGIPITPHTELHIPERPLRLQVAIVRAAASMPWVALFIDRYAAAASAEMAALFEHLLALARRNGVEAPLLTALATHLPLAS